MHRGQHTLIFPLVIALTTSLTVLSQPLHWDWSKIGCAWSTLKKELPTNQFPATDDSFEWGVGDSAFQTEGTQMDNGQECENNWTGWPRVKDPVGHSVNRWQHYKQDIDRIKACGFNTYRLSVEWSKIEPQKGCFNQESLNHYAEVCKYAHSKGLKLYVVLWHHTWPVWFGDLNAFEKAENTAYFVNYADKVVDALSPYVSIWAPFNEPVGYALQGYFRGEYPPGKKSLMLAGTVVGNMLKAHVETAQLIKQKNPEHKVTITHIIHHLDAYSWWNPLEQFIARTFDYLTNTALINFFKTGTFSWLPTVSYTNLDAPHSIDFFGVNYYSHTNIKARPIVDAQAAHAWEKRSSNGALIYPEGLYRAIQRSAVIGKPLVVTENGVADNDNTLKDEFIRTHLYALLKSLHDGYDVRGYHYWTFMNNFEWNKGYQQKFGLHEIDANGNRTLCPNAHGFIDFLTEHQEMNRHDDYLLIPGLI